MSISDAFTVLSQGYTPSIILAVIAVLLLIRQRLALDLDPREPPILKPRVPYIGHIIGLFTYHTGYYDRVLYVTSKIFPKSSLTLTVPENPCPLQLYLC